MRLRTVSSIYTMQDSSPDDLFICSASFEERCMNAANILSNSYSARESLMIQFSGEYKKDYQKTLSKDILPSFAEKETIMELDRNDVISFWYNLDEWFGNRRKLSLITLDISTFTKSFLLILLKVLRNRFPNAQIRIVYTMAYYPTLSKSVRLSWGIKDVILLPYFGSLRNAKNGKNLLILFLGYEADRAYSVWEFVEPSRTVAVIGDPPTYLRADVPTRSLNKFILEHPETVVETSSALNPIESKMILSKWYEKKEYQDFLFFISPLGTKMQLVGIYLFFEEWEPLTKAKIVYALPARYNEEKYSVGYERGKVWECLLPKRPLTNRPKVDQILSGRK